MWPSAELRGQEGGALAQALGRPPRNRPDTKHSEAREVPASCARFVHLEHPALDCGNVLVMKEPQTGKRSLFASLAKEDHLCIGCAHLRLSSASRLQRLSSSVEGDRTFPPCPH